MSEDWKTYSFVNYMVEYHKRCTDAPPQFSEHIAIQLLGHVMGYQPINLIQPKAVRHNVYLCLVGDSTWTRKSTSQGFGMSIYPIERTMPAETSPEQFIVMLSKHSELLQFIGEWTGMLKGVTGKGYMARFVEVMNDIHSCPPRYVRELREKKGEDSIFEVKNAYFSANSTVTPEGLKENLTSEIVFGGFGPRWIFVKGEPNPRPRQRLHRDTPKIENQLKDILNAVIQMEEKEVRFILSDEAIRQYNEIEKSVMNAYEKCSAFAGRYLNYIVSYADILMVSDAIGKAVNEGKVYGDTDEVKTYGTNGLITFNGLIHLISLIQLDKVNKILIEPNSRETLSDSVEYQETLNTFNDFNFINSVHYAIVPSTYILRAWQLIKPCLDYALELADYVEMDKSVLKLSEYLKKVTTSPRYRALQYTHLTSKQLDEAERTLEESHLMKTTFEKVSREGAGNISKKTYTWLGVVNP